MINIFTPPDISREEKIRQHLVGVSQHASDSLENTINNYETTLKSFWENPEFTAQELFDYYGNQAYKLLQESDKVWNFIKTYKPEYVPKAAIKPFTVNEDGTVTVLPDPEPEPITE